MTRFLKTILKFLLISSGSYLMLLILFAFLAPIGLNKNQNYNHNYYGFNKTRLHEVKKYKNIDILFLGSSHAYRGFDTRIFKENGYTSFNLGSSSQSPIQTKILLDRYLTQLNPKLIIWELTPSSMASDGVESALDVISNDQNDLGSFKMAFSINNIRVYNTLFIALISELFNSNRQQPEENHNKNDTYIKGGFVEKKLKFYKAKQANGKKTFNPNNKQLSSVNKIVASLKNKNIDYLMLCTPITEERKNEYKNLNGFHEFIISVRNFKNYHSISQLNDSIHFYDSHHLNQKGVEIFNREILNFLESKNIKSHTY